jgi:hypothetical protein
MVARHPKKPKFVYVTLREPNLLVPYQQGDGYFCRQEGNEDGEWALLDIWVTRRLKDGALVKTAPPATGPKAKPPVPGQTLPPREKPVAKPVAAPQAVSEIPPALDPSQAVVVDDPPPGDGSTDKQSVAPQRRRTTRP